MSVKIRLKRMGRKKAPHFRVVVADTASPRDGRFVEALGYYKPLSEPARLVLDLERVDYWIGKGATPSNTVKSLIVRAREGGDETVAVGEVDAEERKQQAKEALAAKRAAEEAAAKEEEEARAAAEAEAAAAAEAAEAEAAEAESGEASADESDEEADEPADEDGSDDAEGSDEEASPGDAAEDAAEGEDGDDEKTSS